MHCSAYALAALLFASPALCARSSQNPPGKDAILLSNVQALTLRGNRLTTSRRVSPIPQLTCVGPSKTICEMFEIDTMRCTNEGYDYDAEDVQWTCAASLPPEFKLGATDVVCEGYRSSDDKWVLKGSCGVEYRLLLTEQGEKRFGDLRNADKISGSRRGNKKASSRGFQGILNWLGELIFFGFFIAVSLVIFGPLIASMFGWRRNQRPREPRRGWGGFWGGGGGGGDDGYPPGPPPPYSSCSDSNSFAFGGQPSSRGWTPGFWTGALGGAAAGYQMGRRAGNGSSPFQRGSSFRSDNGEGSSRSRSMPAFSSTTTSTGFGSTRRR